VKTLVTTAPTFADAWRALCARGSDEDEAPVREAAARVVADVRARGDAALLDYTARWDRWLPASAAALALEPRDFAAAWRGLPAAGRKALQLAADRVRAFHERERDAEVPPGT
jgi:histidinol dehydrogenase